MFHYKKVDANHYLFKRSVYSHNTWRHDDEANQILSDEETWDTKCWENRAFTLWIAIKELNAYLAMKHLSGVEKDVIIIR